MFPTMASSSHPPSYRMVKIELEAAEALAGLAHSSVTETLVIEFGSNGGKSLSRRVKNESPAADSESHSRKSVPRSSDLAEQDRVVVVQQHCQKICNMMTKPIQAEQDAELQPSSIGSTTYAPSVGSKSRQNLNEAEKEARRVRRVLANRESARQTIRRRQALYEELTRKADHLAWENENLKKEKELTMKEYDSLKSTNESLKAQMTKIVKAEVEETRENMKLSNVEIPTSPSTSFPAYVYNQPSFLPFLWPSIIPPSNVVPLQCGPRSGIAIPSQVPMPASDKPCSFTERENPIRINAPGTTLYVLPYPWLFPLSHHANELHPQFFDLRDEQNDILLKNMLTSSSSKTMAIVENHHLLPPIKASNSAEPVPANNLHDNPFGFPPDGDGQHIGPQSRGAVFIPAPLSCVKPAVTVEHENIPRPKQACDLKAMSAAAGDIVNGSLEMNKEPIVCPSKKLVDVAAAEVRKKGKELTRLKNLHSRQFRMAY